MAGCHGEVGCHGDDEFGNHPNHWRSGFLGQYGAVWSSCKQKGHLAMARVVKASLYSRGSVTD